MKKYFIFLIFCWLFSNSIKGQEWMRSLSVAQNLALVQDKMVLMVWEETTRYPYPVIVEDDKGRKLIVRDLFTDEYISPIIWDYFVPVIVSEDQYEDMYANLEEKRKQSYLEKFNDDSIKIMDVNGYILNASPSYDMYENISKIIQKYALHTEFINTELRNYRDKKDVYSGYYLASKYLDFAMLMEKNIRAEVIELAELYINDIHLLLDQTNTEEKPVIRQRLELLEIQKDLITDKPRPAIRKLKRMEKDSIEEANLTMYSFLFYTTNMCLDRPKEASAWKSNISSVNLIKSQKIINLNN
jgi:hypothetical protein